MDKDQIPGSRQARVQHFAAATLLPLWIDGQHQRMFEEIDDYVAMRNVRRCSPAWRKNYATSISAAKTKRTK